MIKSLYDKYFQKSRTFLFPVLGIKKSSPYPPLETYLVWADRYGLEDRVLICKFKVEQSEAFQNFEQRMLRGNPLFKEQLYTKDGYGLYVFSMNAYPKDWDLFLEGRYSQLSPILKKAIKEYYGADSAEYEYIDTYLNPSKYFELYAKLLSVKKATLESVGELCNKYDVKKETLITSEKDLENLENSLYICRP